MTGESGHVITPADQATLLRGPLGAVLMLAGNRTGGRLSLVEHPLEPRALGSPLHTHRDEDEYSVVLEGQVGAQIGGQTVVAGPGTVLVKPRGVPHAFWNPTDQPAVEPGLCLGRIGRHRPAVTTEVEVVRHQGIRYAQARAPRSVARSHGRSWP